MAKIKAPRHRINRILHGRGKKSYWYASQIKRIYIRKDGKFVAIGWKIVDGSYENKTIDIVLDEDIGQ